MIAGVGLIGGSFALAIRRGGFRGRILGLSSPATVAAARSAGVIDGEANWEQARDADLVLLAQPIRVILESLPRLAGARAWVTDAGSTKRSICRAAAAMERFTGGHPMAGKAVRSVSQADAGLFENRPWIFTSVPPAPLQDLVERTGARLTVTTPEDHDRAVALTSHLPQLLSSALASLGKDQPGRLFAAGPGWESMTRLAASDWALWRDILETNGDFILEAWSEYVRRLDPAIRALPAGPDSAEILFRRP